MLCFNAVQPVRYTKLYLLAYEGNIEGLKKEIKKLKNSVSSFEQEDLGKTIESLQEYKKKMNEENRPDYIRRNEPIDHYENYLTPLDGGVLGGSIEVVKLLLDNGADKILSRNVSRTLYAHENSFYAMKQLLKQYNVTSKE